jgi:signal transduction histidine kinase
MTGSTDRIGVLLVDDDDAFLDAASARLEREDGRFAVATATDGREALATLADRPVDCVVSGYAMPEMDGLALLDAVRADHPDLPFVLFTDEGSESVAAGAVSAGATDYLRRDAGAEQYATLADRVADAVERRRAERADERRLRRQNRRLGALHGATHAVLGTDDPDDAAEVAVSKIDDVLEMPLATLWRYDPARDALVPRASTDASLDLFESPPTYDRGEGLSWEAFASGETIVVDDLRDRPARFNADTPARSEMVIPLDDIGVLNIASREPAAFDDDDVTVAELWAATVAGVLTRLDREATLREREAELRRERDRLEEFASLVSHDLRNPLTVAEGRLELAREECESEHLGAVDRALDRMEELIEDVLTVARGGTAVEDREPVDLDEACRTCWEVVADEEATLDVESDATVLADRSRLEQLLSNLFRNAVEHGTTDDRWAADGSRSSDGDCAGSNGGVHVVVGDRPDGFFVEDDGPGVPEGDREAVFEAGYTTAPDGTGFGLRIVGEIASAHGWSVDLTAGREGGARFEVTGVDRV